MNKEQSADDPLRGSDSCKNMLNNCISMSYLHSVAIACIEHKVSLETFKQLKADVSEAR